MGRPGNLVISLDFELYWGVRDKRSIAAYRDNLLGVRRAVPALCALFERHAIRATWATVGLLFCTGRDDALRASPELKPAYRNPRYSPYLDDETWGRDESSDPFHFAPSLLDVIARTPHQEIATHTFSHFYALEDGQDARAFEADLSAAVAVAARRGIELRSIVFPRNQVNPAYLPLCARAGLTSYRGTLRRGIYRPRNEDDQNPVVRALRLADNYVPITPDRSLAPSDFGVVAPYDLAASSFLRPHWGTTAALDGRRLARLTSELTRVAREGRTYHLWWHPHNFGRDLAENLRFLERILQHVGDLRRRFGLESLTMSELAAQHGASLRGVAA